MPWADWLIPFTLRPQARRAVDERAVRRFAWVNLYTRGDLYGGQQHFAMECSNRGSPLGDCADAFSRWCGVC
jgi:hypothetical protein